MKTVKDFKRGEEIPDSAKFISSRPHTKTEDFNGGHPLEMDTRIVEQYYIDTYEVFSVESKNKEAVEALEALAPHFKNLNGDYPEHRAMETIRKALTGGE